MTFEIEIETKTLDPASAWPFPKKGEGVGAEPVGTPL